MFVRSVDDRIPRVFLSRWVDHIVRHLSSMPLSSVADRRLRACSELTLVFTSELEIQRLNREFRGKNKATDVLSFAPTDEGSLGELVFSLSVLRKQAGEHGLTMNQELGYMVLHGVLHLLGYDHETSPREARRMFELQDKVFDAVLSRW